MPIQAPSWTEFLSCPICCNEFAHSQRLPISLGCGHTICRQCLATLNNRQCPFDQSSIAADVDSFPINHALLQLVSENNSASCTNNNNNNSNDENDKNISFETTEASNMAHMPSSVRSLCARDLESYNIAKNCIEEMALHLKSFLAIGNFGSLLSRPMQRKLVSLVNCQLMEEEGRVRALRSARSLGERTVTELILQHQNPQQLSSNLWAAVRSRGCQFLGPAMQEEVLKLVLQALADGTALSRKVLVMFVVQRLEPNFPQASKTSIGHVVQLLYRASCFKVSKREADSSLMQLKEEFRTYDALRREHDAQIVQIATEAGLRIAPDQWSSLLYGDTMHKSHMQSIIDKLQTPSSFAQSVQELVIALQRTGDPAHLSGLGAHLKHLAGIDPSLECAAPTWQEVAAALDAVRYVVIGLVDFAQHHGNRKLQECVAGQGTSNAKYKVSLCRDLTARRICPRGSSCTFAHSEEELERYRSKNRKHSKTGVNAASPLIAKNGFQAHMRHTPSLLLPGNENASPISSATSPLRYTTHAQANMAAHSAISETLSPQHFYGSQSLTPGHHMRPLHHSPIPLANGAALFGAVQPIAVPPMRHRLDQHFGNMNFSVPPPRLPNLAGINNGSTLGMSNAAGNRNFSNAAHPSSASSMPLKSSKYTIPPNYQDNAVHAGSSLNRVGLYNMLTSELYSSTAFNNNNNVNQQHVAPALFPNSSSNSNNNRHSQASDSSAAIMNGKLEAAASPLWSVAGQLQSFASNNDLLDPNVYRSNASFFDNKTEVAQSQNALEKANTADAYNFKNTFASKANINNNNNSSGNNNNNSQQYPVRNYTKENLLAIGGMGYIPPSAPSFWDSNSSSVPELRPGAVSTRQKVATAAATSNFRGGSGDGFVRSDSILDDETATYDLPVTSASSMGSKYGPICPMYKGMPTSTATEASTNNNFIDSWSDCLTDKLDDMNLFEGSNLYRNPTSYTAFSNNNINNLALQLQQQQQQQQQQRRQQTEHADTEGLEAAIAKLSNLHFNNNSLNSNTASIADGRHNFDLGLSGLAMMGNRNSAANCGTDENNDYDPTKSTSMLNNSLFWGSSSNNMKSKACDLDATRSLWNDATTTTKSKSTMSQSQQQQRATRLADESYESDIDNNLMRDIELNLAGIVDKVWTSADDSGIKLE